MTILFAYEGADAAFAAAGSLLTHQDGGSVVVSVWDPAIVEGLRAVKFGAPPRSPWTPPSRTNAPSTKPACSQNTAQV